MVTIHQSELTQYARCPAAAKYERQSQKRTQLSATAYGSVMHYALLEVFERRRHHDGSLEDATTAAVETFRHYWHPLNITAICEPVDVWLPKQTYNSLLTRGEEQIKKYADLVANREEEILATELGFQVPIIGTRDADTGQPHILAGTIDRLTLVKKKGNWILAIEDVKSGKDYTYLRQNMQFTAYCYATTRPEFWTGWNGEDGFGAQGQELFDQLDGAPRKGTWINLNKMSFQDAGWRGPKDYARFAIAANELAKAERYDVYPLNISGQTCTFCEFRDTCAGIGVADDEHGAPTPKYPIQGTRRKTTS